MGGEALRSRALFAMAFLCGLSHGGLTHGEPVAPAGDSPPAGRVQPNSPPAQYFAILGEISRPGVFQSAKSQWQLADLLDRAGGALPSASGNVRVIRDGRAGHQAFLTGGLKFHLLPNDVVILDSRKQAFEHRSGAASSARSGIVQLGLVNLISRPIVLDVPVEQATLRTVLSLLHNPLIDRAVVTIIRPVGGLEVVDGVRAADRRLVSGSVLVFNQSEVEAAVLPPLPATVPMEANDATDSALPATTRETPPDPTIAPDAPPSFALQATVAPFEPLRLSRLPERAPRELPPHHAESSPGHRKTRAIRNAADGQPDYSRLAKLLVVAGVLAAAMVLLWLGRTARVARLLDFARRPATQSEWLLKGAIREKELEAGHDRSLSLEPNLTEYRLQEPTYGIDAGYATGEQFDPIELPRARPAMRAKTGADVPAVSEPARKFRLDAAHQSTGAGAVDRALAALDRTT